MVLLSQTISLGIISWFFEIVLVPVNKFAYSTNHTRVGKSNENKKAKRNSRVVDTFSVALDILSKDSLFVPVEFLFGSGMRVLQSISS
jgi:hypothetical protein